MKDRRFRLMVSPFQYKLLVRMVSYWLIYQVSLWNFLFFWRLIEEGKGDPLDQYFRFFGDYYPMFFCFVILVPFFAWDAIRMSHRLLGAINRFRTTMRAIAAGQPVRPIRLRAGDELGEMQTDFNAMLQVLQERGLVVLADGSRPPEAAPPVALAVVDGKTPEGDPHERTCSRSA